MKTDQDRAIEADASGPRNDFLARAMYEAYTASSGGLNYQGKPCPKWDELPEAICKHWHAAADVARARGARNIGPYRDAVAAARAFEFAQALAERDAGEAERVREAVARACEDAAQIADRYGHAHIADAIRALAAARKGGG